MASRSALPARGERDPLAAILEGGLSALLVLAPLPFGSVLPWSRGVLEAGALILLAVWLLRGLLRPTALPPAATQAGLAGLLALALVQALPTGPAVVGALSPRALELRDRVAPTGDALAAERRLLGIEPSALDALPALSLSPERTASALRGGAALAALVLVATTVVAERGARRLAWALLFSSAFQGLYGTIVLASRHDRIWGIPKVHYLDSATGTFVNRNHFAAYLAASLAVGAGLLLSLWPRSEPGGSRRGRWLALVGREGSRALFAVLLTLAGLVGLLLSFSRAGIAVGGISLGLVLLFSGRSPIRRRGVAAFVLISLAALPLVQIGADRLAARYARSGEDLTSVGGRLHVWKDTLEGIRQFPLVGSGFGTFAEVYPLFRSTGVRLRYEHAHQETLQLAAEGGVLGVALLVLALAPALRRALRTLGRGQEPLAAGLAAAFLGLLLHAQLDFAFRIPAVAATAATIVGALLGTSCSRAR